MDLEEVNAVQAKDIENKQNLTDNIPSLRKR